MKKIDISQPIYDTIKAHPELKDVFIELGFKPLKNKMLLQTAGRVTSLEKGIDHIGISFEDLETALNEKGYTAKDEPFEEAATSDHKAKTQTTEEQETNAAPDMNAREEEQQEKMAQLKDLLVRLHQGEDEETIKADFKKHFDGISPLEVAVLERKLVAEEGIDIQEIMRLCNVHLAIMGEAVEGSGYSDEMNHPGHPVQVIKQQNLAIEAAILRIRNLVEAYLAGDEELRDGLQAQLDILKGIDRHYDFKELLLFPIMEKKGITTPPQVMWGVDDEIRAMSKQVNEMVQKGETKNLKEKFEKLAYEIEEMIVKEEQILIPMISDVFTEEDWLTVASQMHEVGFAFISKPIPWKPEEQQALRKNKEPQDTEELQLGVGHLSPSEIKNILDALPLELSFVGADDTVKYFNRGEEEKIFQRTTSAIDRDIMYCHPPRVHEAVRKVIDALKSGKMSERMTVSPFKGKIVMVSFVAVRDEEGNYLGILESVQDVTKIVEMGAKYLK